VEEKIPMTDTETKTVPKPTSRSRAAWTPYWQAQGQPWRTEPEIDAARQAEMAEHLHTRLDIKRGQYPFRDVTLTRADIEWLLATHENGRGPVFIQDLGRSDRWGLDLRGADLRGLDLHRLPLARTRFALTATEWLSATPEQREWAAAHLEGANLFKARLERIHGIQAHFEGADLRLAHLEGAILYRTRFCGGTIPPEDLPRLRERRPDFPAQLAGADLSGAFMNTGTDLDETILGDATSCAQIANLHWGEVNLTVLPWRQVRLTRLGDEWRARTALTPAGKPKDRATRLTEFENAVRANRQLAVILCAQGMNEQADAFAYRAHLCEREVLRREGNAGGYLGSLFLDLLAGYGYRPVRSFIAYLIIIFGFMGLYLLNAQFVAPHLTWDEALVLSVSSFHGRGFFATTISLGDTYARLAAGEAVLGLIIEISFIATFTQRFFGK